MVRDNHTGIRMGMIFVESEMWGGGCWWDWDVAGKLSYSF